MRLWDIRRKSTLSTRGNSVAKFSIIDKIVRVITKSVQLQITFKGGGWGKEKKNNSGAAASIGRDTHAHKGP